MAVDSVDQQTWCEHVCGWLKNMESHRFQAPSSRVGRSRSSSRLWAQMKGKAGWHCKATTKMHMARPLRYVQKDYMTAGWLSHSWKMWLSLGIIIPHMWHMVGHQTYKIHETTNHLWNNCSEMLWWTCCAHIMSQSQAAENEAPLKQVQIGQKTAGMVAYMFPQQFHLTNLFVWFPMCLLLSVL